MVLRKRCVGVAHYSNFLHVDLVLLQCSTESDSVFNRVVQIFEYVPWSSLEHILRVLEK